MMKPLPHHYAVHLTGGPADYAQFSTAGVPELRTAPPEDYEGPGDAWSPEHPSVQACFLFTLHAIAHLSKLNSRLSSWTRRTRDRHNGVTPIRLEPEITEG